MSPSDMDLIERMLASSPPLLIMSMICVVVLWRKLEAREAKHDAVMLEALAEVTSAVRALGDEIRARR